MELVWQGKGPEVYGKLVRKMKHLTSFYHNNQHVRAAMFVINSDPDQEDMLYFSRPNETRRSSIFLMGERLMANYTFMWEHAGSLGLGEDKYLSPLDIRVVGELLAVLAPFYKATQLFQTTTTTPSTRTRTRCRSISLRSLRPTPLSLPSPPSFPPLVETCSYGHSSSSSRSSSSFRRVWREHSSPCRPCRRAPCAREAFEGGT